MVRLKIFPILLFFSFNMISCVKKVQLFESILMKSISTTLNTSMRYTQVHRGEQRSGTGLLKCSYAVALLSRLWATSFIGNGGQRSLLFSRKPQYSVLSLLCSQLLISSCCAWEQFKDLAPGLICTISFRHSRPISSSSIRLRARPSSWIPLTLHRDGTMS